MKKTLFVMAIAAVFVLAIAGSAFAVNQSGQARLGASLYDNAPYPTQPAGEGPDIVSPAAVGIDVEHTGTWTYQNWSIGTGQLDDIADNAGENSPHGNYTTTTVKCVVCHAVHYAAPGMAPVGSGQEADTLLRMKASDACIYCHATAGVAVNGRPVYNGLGAAILSPVGNTGGAKNTGHVIGTNCNVCHATVHGTGADHSVASLEGYLLLKLDVADNGFDPTVRHDTSGMLEAMEVIDAQAQNQGFAADTALPSTLAEYAGVNNSTLARRGRRHLLRRVPQRCVRDRRSRCDHQRPWLRLHDPGRLHRPPHRCQRVLGLERRRRCQLGRLHGHDRLGSRRQLQELPRRQGQLQQRCLPARVGRLQRHRRHRASGTKMWLMSAADAGAQQV